MSPELTSDLPCRFCRDGTPSSALSDTRLLSGAGFYPKPALGSFLPGYCLLIPYRHVARFGDLTPDELEETEIALENLKRKLTALYDKPIMVFEHGSVLSSGGARSCIPHAHLHVVPSAEDIRSQLDALLKPVDEPMSGIASSARVKHAYLYYSYANASVIYRENEPVHSQFIRRVLAESVGLGDFYDWGVWPFLENIEQLIRRFGSGLKYS